MHIYRIENIAMQPLTVVADDFDHAARQFRFALTRAFGNEPVVDFEVARWKLKSGPAKAALKKLTTDTKAGFFWVVDDGQGYELVNPTPSCGCGFGIWEPSPSP